MQLIAHRYGNTVDDLRRVRDVADLIEVDVHYRHGRVEVRHAKRIWFTSRHWERWHILPEGQEFPHFDEIVEAAGADAPLWIDCKGLNPKLPAAILAIVGPEHPLTVSSKSWWLLDRFGSRPGVRRMRSAGNRFERLLLRRVPSRTRLDGVVLHQRLLTEDLVREFRQRFGAVFAWAVNDPETAGRMAAWGVDGVIIDEVELIESLVAARVAGD